MAVGIVRPNVAIILDRMERGRVRDEVWSAPEGPAYVKLRPPLDWRHPVTGRHELEPEPLLVVFGRYVRRARALAEFSQEGLARRAGVSQSTISRCERGLTHSLGLDPLTRMGRALGRALPLGFCPHDHHCAWQLIVPRPDKRTEIERIAAVLLGLDTNEDEPGNPPSHDG